MMAKVRQRDAVQRSLRHLARSRKHPQNGELRRAQTLWPQFLVKKLRQRSPNTEKCARGQRVKKIALAEPISE
jgi:hypothetical protein